MMCFCFVPCAGSCGVRRTWVLLYPRVVFVFPFPRGLSMAPGSLIPGGRKREKEPCTANPPPLPCAALLHCTVAPLSLSSLSFSFCHTQPANAMRQLFQTTISLCVAEAVVRTHSFSFFPCFFFPSLWSPPPLYPPSRPASSWTPVHFSCATQSRYMRKCVHARMHTYVHTYIHTWEGRGTRQRDLCFSTFPPSFFS